jgi:hypothetical protein
MISKDNFPHLTADNHRITSPEDREYNCIAWAVGDVEHWWQPGVFWPAGLAPDDFSVQGLKNAFQALGFEPCEDGTLEPGFERVAVYGIGQFYSHAARQLPNGKWSSKLGKYVDIEHDFASDVAGGAYGELLHFLKRQSAKESKA